MKLQLCGTEFDFTILPFREGDDGYWANLCLSVKSKETNVERTGEYLTRAELKRLICAIGLLLKGKILKKYSIPPFAPGIEIHLIPDVALDNMDREQRETAYCSMEIEISTRDEETGSWKNASTLIRLSRKDIENLYNGLKKEFDQVYAKENETNVLPYLTVRGEAGEFYLSIVGYEFGFPRERRDWDDDWLEIKVEFLSNGQKNTYTDPSLLTSEFEEMILEMQTLLLVEKGELHSNFLEPYFVLNAFRDGDRFELEVKFFDDPESDDYNWKNTNTLARETCTKTEYLKKLYALKSMLEAFPPRDGRLKVNSNTKTIDPNINDGEYLYVGVSPKGHYGYNYWYIDEAKQTQANTYVWVNMGKRNTEQLVYVDSVRYCNVDNVPYPLDKTKRVIRQATEEEMDEADNLWNE